MHTLTIPGNTSLYHQDEVRSRCHPLCCSRCCRCQRCCHSPYTTEPERLPPLCKVCWHLPRELPAVLPPPRQSQSHFLKHPLPTIHCLDLQLYEHAKYHKLARPMGNGELCRLRHMLGHTRTRRLHAVPGSDARAFAVPHAQLQRTLTAISFHRSN